MNNQEQILRGKLTALQIEVGIKDHGWALGSEIQEIKQKIIVDKKGDWRAKHGEAYNLGFEIFKFEQNLNK